MTFFKVVTIHDDKYFSYASNDHDAITRVEYKIGEPTHAPAELDELGYGLCTFGNPRTAKTFITRRCNYPYDNIAVFECRLGSPVWRPHVPLLYGAGTFAEFHSVLYHSLVEQWATGSQAWFPEGTIMSPKVTLIKQLCAGKEIDKWLSR